MKLIFRRKVQKKETNTLKNSSKIRMKKETDTLKIFSSKCIIDIALLTANQ